MPIKQSDGVEEDKQRLCKEGWIEAYMAYNEGQESPPAFHLWCGLSTIAATLERWVYIDRGRYRLYPNLYVILISESATSRRSTAIKNASPFIRTAAPFTNFISQKITEEKLYHDLHLQWKKTNTSSGYLINDEITTLLGDSKKDSGLIGAITELYGCADVWSYGTLKRDKDVLKNVCLNILGGSAPEWLRAGLPYFAVKGGFVGRLIFVYQQAKGKRVAFPDLTAEQILLKDDLIHDLKMIKEIRGEYTYTAESREWFKHWYEVVLKVNVDAEHGLEGYFGRKHDTVLKLGMIIAASRREGYILEVEDLKEGLAYLEANEKHLPATMKLIQSSDAGEQMTMVLNIIKMERSIQHFHLLRKVNNRLKAADLKEILEGLIASCEIKVVTRDRKRYYTPT